MKSRAASICGKHKTIRNRLLDCDVQRERGTKGAASLAFKTHGCNVTRGCENSLGCLLTCEQDAPVIGLHRFDVDRAIHPDLALDVFRRRRYQLGGRKLRMKESFDESDVPHDPCLPAGESGFPFTG